MPPSDSYAAHRRTKQFWLKFALPRLCAVGFFPVVAPSAALATGSVLLAWNPGNSTNVVGYRIYYGLSSGVYNSILQVGGAKATNATVTGLTSGSTYYLAATAVDKFGEESQFSNEAVYSVPTYAATYQPPTLNALPNVVLSVNAGVQTLALSGISAGAGNPASVLTVTATSSRPGLIPNPTIIYSSPDSVGLLEFTPAKSTNGTVTLSVTVNNNNVSNNLITRRFTVTIQAANSTGSNGGPANGYGKSSWQPHQLPLEPQNNLTAVVPTQGGAPPVDFPARGATLALPNGHIGVIGMGIISSNWTLWATTNLTLPIHSWNQNGMGTITSSPFQVDTGIPCSKIGQFYFRFSSP